MTLSAHVDDREHHAVSEAVVDAPLLAAADKARVEQLVARIPLRRHRVHERMERVGRIAETEPVHRAPRQAAADEILLRRAVFRPPQRIVVKPCSVPAQGIQTVAVPRGAAFLLALLGHLHACPVGQIAHRIGERQSSAFITNVMTPPPAPQPKQWKICLSGETENEPVFFRYGTDTGRSSSRRSFSAAHTARPRPRCRCARTARPEKYGQTAQNSPPISPFCSSCSG